jgi:hypothetical protein
MADPIAELLAIASPSSSAPDDVVSWASIPLTSEELYVPDRDIPMEAPLETRGLLAPLETEEIAMQGAPSSLSSCSPRPQIRQDQEENDEPTPGLE